MPDAIGPGEAARRLGVSTRTVQRWLREGRLPGVRVGSRLKVAAAALPGATNEAKHRPIARLLVANRGELVVRIARTCRHLGVRCLALVPPDQAQAWWVGAADEIVPLAGSYLDIEAVLAAARAAKADAIHPGYGFLAENPTFAEQVLESGLTWVGPPPAAMRALGDKAAARQLAVAAGVPVLPGYDGDDQSDKRLLREARRIGLPLLIKPSAGGGGKGMHVVGQHAELPDLLAQARREARVAFGDERLVLERYLARPRHVEVQLLADSHGAAVHLGERECSLQRRHQKVIEEAPSPAVDATLRARLGEAALALARAAGYQGAGTAEFLLSGDGSFHFLELNARLQVEHPVTELVTGRDLVADQLRIAAGEPLGVEQDEISLLGHAIEARLYAEDPHAGFLPAAGEIIDVAWPALEGVRVDAGVGSGDVVGTRYDPLLAKVIAHGSDRAEALTRLEQALAATSVLGVTTNRGFLRWLLQLAEVQSGALHTHLLEQGWRPSEELPAAAWAEAASALAANLARHGRVAAVQPGFRLNAPPMLRLEIEGQARSVEVRSPGASAARWRPLAHDGVVLDLEGRALRAHLAAPPTVEAAVRQAAHSVAGRQVVTAAMPGAVLALRVVEGEAVEAGQVLLVLEAMKMENAVSAPGGGRVPRVLVEAGQQVQRGDALLELD
ncbi:acetyl-CoA carboxylase biotin carboxylase subunit [soil metagenome]